VEDNIDFNPFLVQVRAFLFVLTPRFKLFSAQEIINFHKKDYIFIELL
jgi:hypothetical protein